MTTPETIYSNVQFSPFFSILGGEMKLLRIADRLQFRFGTYLGAHVYQQSTSTVPYLNMAMKRKSPF